MLLLPLSALLLSGCGNAGSTKQNINEMTNAIGRKTMVEEYPKVPGDELLEEMPGNILYSDLCRRYTQHLANLKAATDSDNVKLVVLVMTPEVGKFYTVANMYGIPYIQQICTNLKIDISDITPAIAEWSAVNDGRRDPVVGDWSRAGAAYAAQCMAEVIRKNMGYKSGLTFQDKQRPATLGDCVKETKEEKDEEGTPTRRKTWRVSINKQGLRSDEELRFPKTRQRVVLLGDSRVLNPYLDDDYTIAYLLQRQFENIEIVNAGYDNYCMDDYHTLYTEKTRYAEPDVVIVCTNGGDITDEYFSHRNRYSRNRKCYKPTDGEVEFYKKAYSKPKEKLINL